LAFSGDGDDEGEIRPDKMDDEPDAVIVDEAADVGDEIGEGVIGADAVEALFRNVSRRLTTPATSLIRPTLPKASKYISKASPDSNRTLLPCSSDVNAIVS
jgi:hypothetical protein